MFSTPSHGDSETKSSTVGRSSTLVGRVTPGGPPWTPSGPLPKPRAPLIAPGRPPWNHSWSPLVGRITPHQASTYF